MNKEPQKQKPMTWGDKVRTALKVENGNLSYLTRKINAMKHLVKLNPKRYSFSLSYNRLVFTDKKNPPGSIIVDYRETLNSILNYDLKKYEDQEKKRAALEPKET